MKLTKIKVVSFMVLVILGVLLFGNAGDKVFAASGMVTFNSGSGITGTTATDGQGGSTDISDITLQFSAKEADTNNDLTLTYEVPYEGNAGGISAGYETSISQGAWHIKSTNLSQTFSLQSIYS